MRVLDGVGDVGHAPGDRGVTTGRLRPILKLVGLAVTYFVILFAIAQTGFYPPLFRAGANTLFGSMGSGRVAQFEPFDDPQGVFDTKMSVGSDLTGSRVFPSSLGVNSLRQGYVPTAVLIGLVLATPIAWRRKWRALLVGIPLVHVFVAMRIGVTLLYGFSRIGLGDRRLLEVSALGSWVLRRGDQILAGDLHMSYVVPLVIWLLTCVRRAELQLAGTTYGSTAPVDATNSRRHEKCPCGSGRKFKNCCE